MLSLSDRFYPDEESCIGGLDPWAVWIPGLRGGGGQEVVLPHVGGAGKWKQFAQWRHRGVFDCQESGEFEWKEDVETGHWTD